MNTISLGILYTVCKIISSVCYIFSTLLDINECATGGGHTCHEKATCQNTPGSFSCTCMPGYSGNGASCRGNVFPCFCSNFIGNRTNAIK